MKDGEPQLSEGMVPGWGLQPECAGSQPAPQAGQARHEQPHAPKQSFSPQRRSLAPSSISPFKDDQSPLDSVLGLALTFTERLCFFDYT